MMQVMPSLQALRDAVVVVEIGVIVILFVAFIFWMWGATVGKWVNNGRLKRELYESKARWLSAQVERLGGRLRELEEGVVAGEAGLKLMESGYTLLREEGKTYRVQQDIRIARILDTLGPMCVKVATLESALKKAKHAKRK